MTNLEGLMTLQRGYIWDVIRVVMTYIGFITLQKGYICDIKTVFMTYLEGLMIIQKGHGMIEGSYYLKDLISLQKGYIRR